MRNERNGISEIVNVGETVTPEAFAQSEIDGGETLKSGETSRKKIGKSGKNPAYSAQYKFLSERSQLRVWVKKDKFERFRNVASQNNTSIYRLVNEFIDEYIVRNGEVGF